MPDRLHLLVDSQPFAVEVRSGVIIVDGNAAVLLRVTAVGDARYRIESLDGAFDGLAALSGDRIWIAIGDETFECRLAPAHTPRGTGLAGDGLSSPMPATVTAVPVGIGQTVEAGDLLIALEAMKMELPLRAPRRAIVAALHCRVGDLVQPDVVLVELRAESSIVS
jgi:acetyl/propionyl-CoA carboxylase alpha subunit